MNEMDAITKDSPLWRAALALVPPTKADLGPDCHIAHPGTRCPDRRPPDITPDLLYAVRRVIEARSFEWTLQYRRYPDTSERAYKFSVWSTSGNMLDAWGGCEADAIIRAAARFEE